MNYLAVSLSFVDSELSMQYADEAMNLAKEVNYEEGMAAVYRSFGYINYFKGNFADALSNHFESVRIYEKLDKKNIVATMYYSIAVIHFYASNYEKALEYGYIALDKYRERLEGGGTVGSVRDTINVIGGLELTYCLSGKKEKSLELALKFLEVGKRNNFGSTEMMLYTFLVGNRFYSIGDTDSAKLYFEKALAYPDLNPSIEALKYRPLAGLGLLHYAAGEVDSAIFYLRTAFEWYDEKGFLFFAVEISSDLGYIYYKNNDLNNAEKYYQQSERIFNEWLIRNSWYRHDSLKYIVFWGSELYFPFVPKKIKEMMWRRSVQMYYGLYQINVANKKTGEALKYYIAYSNAKDTLNMLKQSRETIELQTKYESERKEGQIESLTQENAFHEFKLKQSGYFLFGLGSLVILVIVLAIILIRQNKLREQQKNLLLQQKLFRSQMNPHFLFNSLSSIHNYIIHEESVKAGQYLSKFSKLVRNILDSSFEEYITLEKEISTIKNYLELQKVRYGKKFDYSIDIDEGIDTESMKIPPMLAQPIIENSIEHGIKHKETSGVIHIRFKLRDSMIIFEVEDDGIGRKKAMETILKQDKDHKSLATTITLERIQVLNKKSKNKISMQILDLKNEKDEPAGTRVTFEIPVLFS